VILFLVVAVVLYLVVPSGLVIGAIIAIVVAAGSVTVSLFAGGPVVFYGARLTASPGRARRIVGWMLVAGGSFAGTAAATVAILMVVLAAAATSTLPTFLPLV
jgi:hypothetical protein